MTNTKIIYVCGIDGSGKTTLANSLVDFYKNQGDALYASPNQFKKYVNHIDLVSEKAKSSRWDEFPEYFRGMMWALELLELSERILNEDTVDNKLIVIDRYMICNKVYSSLESKYNLPYLDKMHSLLIQPDIIIYLDTNHLVANERITKRGEVRTPKEKQRNLELASQKYRQVLTEYDNVIYLDGNREKNVILQDAIQQISNYIGGRNESKFKYNI